MLARIEVKSHISFTLLAGPVAKQRIGARLGAVVAIVSPGSVTVRSLHRPGFNVQHLQNRARSERECCDAPPRLVMPQCTAVAIHRRDPATPSIVDSK